MPDTYEVRPAAGPLTATVRPPGSKSLTNRALVCSAMAAGVSRLTGALDSDDTRVMIAALRELGIDVRVEDSGRVLMVTGCGGKIPTQQAELLVGNSGTTVRFLTALLTLGKGEYCLDGVPRMRERPIGDLAASLNSLGAEVQCESPGNCPPVRVIANGLQGGQASMHGGVSSQFLSGVLMAAPYATNPIELAIRGDLVSKPYIRMTIEVIRAFGADVLMDESMATFSVPTGEYSAREYAIEPDASAASYFWAAAAITQGRVVVEGLSPAALQGDVAFVDCLEQMGCGVERTADAIAVEGRPLKGIDVDMNAISDTVQTLGAVALFAEGETIIRGVGHIRHKETDRIGDLATELRKFGATVQTTESGLSITPPNELQAARVATYDDHRMAMSLALAGLKIPGVQIEDPDCTAKTYPRFFADLQSLY